MNITLVIVTFNRLIKLKHSLDCYENQSYNFSNLIVVNNNSNDGTKEFLSEWENAKSSYAKYVINLSSNMGGSGGFYEGEKFAMSLNPDWIYVADDDAYANPDMIQKFVDYITTHNTTDISAICGAVYEMSGDISYEHRSRINYKFGFIYKKENVSSIEYRQDSFEIDAFSYVCTFMKAKSIKLIGYCNPDLFIYFDDTEHSLRLKKIGKIICVPSIIINHDGGGNQTKNNNDILLDWRKYYSLRNQIYTLFINNPLSAIYELLYSGQHLMRHYISSAECVKMIFAALLNGTFGRLGIHKKYKPGFNIKNKK